MENKKVVLSVKNLSTHFNLSASLFSSSKEKVRALSDVSFELFEGETLGIVGESGSGKTTLAKTIAGIFKKSAGTFDFGDGIESSDLRYVFQDPASSLNPTMTVFEILTHGYKYHVKSKIKNREERKKLLAKEVLQKKAEEVLTAVGLPLKSLTRLPGDFSGGQRQRISLARALIFSPKILICDEVVSALDLSIQAQILNLLVDLKNEFKFTMIFIAHDLSVVSYLCDKIIVMNGGRVVEETTPNQIVSSPLHPYTKLLYDSMPTFSSTVTESNFIDPQSESFLNENCCPFFSRCKNRIDICDTSLPPLEAVDTTCKVACFNNLKK